MKFNKILSIIFFNFLVLINAKPISSSISFDVRWSDKCFQKEIEKMDKEISSLKGELYKLKNEYDNYNMVTIKDQDYVVAIETEYKEKHKKYKELKKKCYVINGFYSYLYPKKSKKIFDSILTKALLKRMVKILVDRIKDFESKNLENIYLELEEESNELDATLRAPFETEEDQNILEPIRKKMEKIKNKIKKCKEILDQLLDLYAHVYTKKFVKKKFYELYKYNNPEKLKFCERLIEKGFDLKDILDLNPYSQNSQKLNLFDELTSKGFSLEHLFSTFSF